MSATASRDESPAFDVLRPMGGYRLPEFLRITVGTVEENDALRAALDAVLA